MDTTQVEEIHIGIRRARLEALIEELRNGLSYFEDGKTFQIDIYDGVPNGRGGEQIKLVFSNDDMEADINPDVDGSKLYIDFEG